MHRLVIAVACLGLAAAGCKKESPPQNAPPPDTTAEAPADTAEDTAEAAAEPEAEEKKLVITEDVVARYLQYWEEELVISRAAIEGIAKEAKKLDGDPGVVDGVQALEEVGDIGDKAERDSEALRKKYGFSESDVGELQELMLEISTARRMAKNSPVEMMKKGLEGVPAEQRAEAEAQLKEMETNFANMINAKDARARWGDAAVDAAMKHEAKILELMDKTIGLMK